MSNFSTLLLQITLAFLVLRVLIAFFNSITPTSLNFSRLSNTAQLSVLIPARNEAANIGQLLADIGKQEYSNLEILVLDDGSTDHTARIVRQFMQQEARCKLLRGKELPDGWLGKNWACHQLAEAATGDYLLFLDADVSINGPLLAGTVARVQDKKLALLSLFPGQEMETPGEWLVVPLMHYLLLSLLPLCFVEWLKHPSLAAANGQFMLFDAAAYKANHWHRMVKEKVTEDIEIMKAVKRKKLRGSTLLENTHIRCRMYHGFMESANGFRKNLLAGFGGSIPGLILYLYLTVFSYALVFFTGNWHMGVIMLLLIIFLRSIISALSGQNPLWNVLLHVPQIFVMLYIAILSSTGKLFGPVLWKGRQIGK